MSWQCGNNTGSTESATMTIEALVCDETDEALLKWIILRSALIMDVWVFEYEYE